MFIGGWLKGGPNDCGGTEGRGNGGPKLEFKLGIDGGWVEGFGGPIGRGGPKVLGV